MTLLSRILTIMCILLGLSVTSQAQECPPDSSYICVDEVGDTISNDSEKICYCENTEPYVPSECDLAMNDVWLAAQAEIDQLVQQPMCENYWNSWFETMDNTSGPVADNAAQNGQPKKKSKYVLVKRKKLRRLQRRALGCE